VRRKSGGALVGTPLLNRDDARLDGLEPVEEPGDLRRGAQPVRGGAGFLVGAERLDVLGYRVGRVAQDEIAPRRQGFLEGVHQGQRVLVTVPRRIADVPDYAHEHDRDGPGEVQFLPGKVEDVLRLRQVPFDVPGRALRGTDEQRPGVAHDHRVVVHVDDPGIRCDPLRHLMRVLIRWQPGADIEELPDSGLARQVAHRAPQEQPRGPGHVPDSRVQGGELVARRLVDLVVVLAAAPVVPDTRRHRNRDIQSARDFPFPVP
jgi:hypothetical protein